MTDYRTAQFDVFGDNTRMYSSLNVAIEEEIHALWCDLAEAVPRTIGGIWSIQCTGLAARISALVLHVGFTHWEHVPGTLLATGVYERLAREMGFTPDVEGIAAWAQAHPDDWTRWGGQSPTASELPTAANLAVDDWTRGQL